MMVSRYTAGAWFALVVDGEIVLLSPDTLPEVLEQVWLALSEGAGIETQLELLTSGHASSMPAFALVSVQNNRLESYLRGDVRLTVRGGELESAPGVATEITLNSRGYTSPAVYTGGSVHQWVSVVVQDLEEFWLSAPDAVGGGSSLPVAAGVVHAAEVGFALERRAPQPEEASDSQTAEAEFDEELDGQTIMDPEYLARVRAQAALLDHTVQSTAVTAATAATVAAAAEQPASQRAIDQVAPPVPPTPQTPATPAVPLAPHREAEHSEAVGSAPAAPTAPTAPVPAASAPVSPAPELSAPSAPEAAAPQFPAPQPPASQPPAPQAPAPQAPAPQPAAPRPMQASTRMESEEDHDGMTIMSSDLVAIRAQMSSWKQNAAPGPFSIPETAPPARLMMSSGLVVTLDRTVLIGRAPVVSRVSNRDLPRVVTVESPNYDISRTHAQVRAEGHRVFVTDLHSTNGIMLLKPGAEPQRLKPGVPTDVSSEVTIDIGDGVTFRAVRSP